jgi:hypothetical protein
MKDIIVFFMLALSWAMMFGGLYLIYKGVRKLLNGGR